jgi:hypothetical protein
MATTVFFVEILAMGILTSIWVFLLLLRIGILDLSALIASLPALKEWITPLLIAAGAVAYQLGSLMNTTSYGLMELISGRRMQRSLMSSVPEFEKAYAIVMHKGSSELVKYIGDLLPYLRFARSAVFNFLFLGLVLISFGSQYRKAAIASLILSVVSYPIWRTIYRTRNADIKAAYEAIKEDYDNRVIGISCIHPSPLNFRVNEVCLVCSSVLWHNKALQRRP